MRTREIEIGDRVHHRCWQSDYEVVAINNGYAWLRTKDASKGVLAALFNLSRIEPAAPQPKFSVGQEVRRVLYGMSGKPMEVIAIRVFEYECRDHEGYHFRVGEDGLEAVPEVCPTCGGTGKVG